MSCNSRVMRCHACRCHCCELVLCVTTCQQKLFFSLKLHFRVTIDLLSISALLWAFLQRVSIASYAKRCISYDRFCPTVLAMIDSVRPSVRPSDRLSDRLSQSGIMPKQLHHAKTTPATIMRSSLEDSPMTLVSWQLTSARDSKGNIGSEGAEWERGSTNVAKIANF